MQLGPLQLPSGNRATTTPDPALPENPNPTEARSVCESVSNDFILNHGFTNLLEQ